MFIHPSNADIASLESAIIPYQTFYRRHGVRRAIQLVAPPLSKLDQLELPFKSILHYLPEDEAQYGPSQDDQLLERQTRLVMVAHHTQLGDDKGPPRPMPIPARSLILDYHRRNRKTRNMLKPEIYMRDPRMLGVQNYALLPHLFRYTTNAFAAYYKWWNIASRMWQTVDEQIQYDRQQYLVCRLPTHMPTYQLLNRVQDGISRQLLERFRDTNTLMILEIYKWLGEYREKSMLSAMSDAAAEQMNLIWVEGDRWFVMNLGELNRWRRPSKSEIEQGSTKEGIVDPVHLQRRFLRSLMTLLETRVAPIEGDAPVIEASPETAEQAKTSSIVIEVPREDGGTRKVTVGRQLDVDSLGEEPVEETAANSQKIDEQIQSEMNALDSLYEQIMALSAESPVDGDDSDAKDSVGDPSQSEYSTVNTGQPLTLEEGFMAHVDALARTGVLSAPEYKRLMKIATAHQNIQSPFGVGTLPEHAAIPPDLLKLDHSPSIPDVANVIDKSMLSSTVAAFDSQYIDQVLTRDVSAMLLNLQYGGVAITGLKVEEYEDAMGRYQIYTVNVTPVRGKSSTLTFRLPAVDSDGTYRSNGVRYRQRKQRSDVPIRKVTPDKVALTSYYSKVFVVRSEKQVNNYPGWITNIVAARGMDSEDTSVTKLMVAKVFDTGTHVPRIYSIMGSRFRSFRLKNIDFLFDYASREAVFGKERVAAVEVGDMVVIGKRGNSLVTVDRQNALYVETANGPEPIGTFETLLELSGRGPIERAEIKVFGKLVPVGMFLGYQMGLTELCRLLDVTPRRVPGGERLHLADDEYALRFSDESWVFRQDNTAATMILGGFLAFEKSIRNYQAHLFDKKEIYLSVLENGKVGMRYLREMDLMVDLFVDPITRDILVEMGEPTTFVGLVRRAVELLESDWAPAETDMRYMRIRGYERMAGAVYSEMVGAVRRMRASGNPGTAKMDLPPYAVSQLIQQDPAVKMVEESNPIHNLKEKEELTFSGVGGRSSRSMVERTRVFHVNDGGIISEASKDSSDVGVTTFLTADPNLTGLRGLADIKSLSEMSTTSIYSTSALLAMASDRDDGKRTQFVSIQNSSTTFADGYRALPTRTGYEQILAHRTDDLFAATAKQKGKVTKITDSSIEVEYEDGTVATVQLGLRFGTVASLTLPHQITTALKAGDVFDKGDLLAYNANFFTPDPLNPKSAVYKAGALVTTAIAENTDTLEDSSAISERAAALMGTQVTTVRNITVSFGQAIHNMVNVGDTVEIDSILCTIEDPGTAEGGLFESDSLDTLRLLAQHTPRADVAGRIDKIEVFYNGDVDDMSDSLQQLALQSDKERRRLARDLRKNYTSGRVDESVRVENHPLLLDNAVIKVYITEHVSAGVGDKGVFANQLKTIFGRIFAGRHESVSGRQIDAIFGYQSIAARIVSSPEVIGTTTTLLIVGSKRMADIYFDDNQ